MRVSYKIYSRKSLRRVITCHTESIFIGSPIQTSSTVLMILLCEPTGVLIFEMLMLERIVMETNDPPHHHIPVEFFVQP